jgi:hypothetical protein
MKKVVKKIRSKPKSQPISKNKKPIAKPVAAAAAKRDFIGRLKGVFQIVGDIESPIEPEAWECSGAHDLERINQATELLNAEASDVLDYQTISRPEFPPDAKKRGRGRPSRTS